VSNNTSRFIGGREPETARWCSSLGSVLQGKNIKYVTGWEEARLTLETFLDLSGEDMLSLLNDYVVKTYPFELLFFFKLIICT
jgi:hypothetical protein